MTQKKPGEWCISEGRLGMKIGPQKGQVSDPCSCLGSVRLHCKKPSLSLGAALEVSKSTTIALG